MGRKSTKRQPGTFVQVLTPTSPVFTHPSLSHHAQTHPAHTDQDHSKADHHEDGTAPGYHGIVLIPASDHRESPPPHKRHSSISVPEEEHKRQETVSPEINEEASEASGAPISTETTQTQHKDNGLHERELYLNCRPPAEALQMMKKRMCEAYPNEPPEMFDPEEIKAQLNNLHDLWYAYQLLLAYPEAVKWSDEKGHFEYLKTPGHIDGKLVIQRAMLNSRCSAASIEMLTESGVNMTCVKEGYEKCYGDSVEESEARKAQDEEDRAAVQDRINRLRIADEELKEKEQEESSDIEEEESKESESEESEVLEESSEYYENPMVDDEEQRTDYGKMLIVKSISVLNKLLKDGMINLDQFVETANIITRKTLTPSINSFTLFLTNTGIDNREKANFLDSSKLEAMDEIYRSDGV